MNKFITIGRLTKDPELRYTQSQKPVASFTIAVNRTFSKENEADFFDCVAWNTTAENICKYFFKGSRIGVSDGRLQTRNYEDKEGIKHKIYEIVVNEFDFIDSKEDNEKRSSAKTSTPAPKYEPKNTTAFQEIDEAEEGELPF